MKLGETVYADKTKLLTFFSLSLMAYFLCFWQLNCN